MMDVVGMVHHPDFGRAAAAAVEMGLQIKLGLLLFLAVVAAAEVAALLRVVHHLLAVLVVRVLQAERLHQDHSPVAAAVAIKMAHPALALLVKSSSQSSRHKGISYVCLCSCR
jgi:hypothetical protein